MMTRRRAGRSYRIAERFARIPVSVLESEAYCALGHAAARILVLLAGQYSGRNNGTMAFTAVYAARFGIKSHDTIYRGLRELESHGLIVKTRLGIKQKNVFALYALGWEEIHNRDGQPLATPERANNAQWLNWRKPRAAAPRAEIQPDSREQTAPTVGSNRQDCTPMSASREAFFDPTTGNTLRISPGGASERAANARASAAADLPAKVRKLSAARFGSDDIARMLSVDCASVRAILESGG